MTVLPNGGRKHPKIRATFEGNRAFIMVIPRGTVKDRAHIRQNYISKTRRAVRELLGAR